MGRSVQTSLTYLFNDVSLATSTESQPLNIKQMEGYAAEYKYTVGSAGRDVTIELQGSNTEDGVFSTIDSYSIDETSGVRLINVEFPRYNYVKVKTTVVTPGGGTLLATVSGKSVE